jgi:hypothetical protein
MSSTINRVNENSHGGDLGLSSRTVNSGHEDMKMFQLESKGVDM